MDANQKFVKDICSDCRQLVWDVLSGNAYTGQEWTICSSEHATLSFVHHLGGVFERLERSVAAGCGLCALLRSKLSRDSEFNAQSNYFIFVWHKTSRKTQFQIVHGPVERFTRHISEWKRPPTITLFGQRPTVPVAVDTPYLEPPITSKGPFLPFLSSSHHGSRESFRQAKEWLRDCRQNHVECSRIDARLPKRVLRLELLDSKLRISLYVTKGERSQYTALSYSWGESDRIEAREEVTKQSLDAPRSDGLYVIERRRRDAESGGQYTRYWDPLDISLDAFPATQRDAIIIASTLGFEFLWLDSLCIVQDSDADWAEQVVELTHIYSGAAFVISATSSKSSADGILNAVANTRLRLGSALSESNLGLDIYAGDGRRVLDLETKYISSRAWVFQERLVSCATLHYMDEGLVWECVKGVQVSHDQNLTNLPWKAEWRKISQVQLSTLSGAFIVTSPRKALNDAWYNWVSAYSEREIYSVTDRFPAIAGVTRRFAQASGFTYVAGLWKEYFLSGLTWHRHNRTKTLVRSRTKYVAPTWSWASVQGRLEHRNVELHDSTTKEKGQMLKVLAYNVEEQKTLRDGQRSYGELCPGATVTVEGLLHKVVLDLHSSPGVRQRSFQEFSVSKGFLNNGNITCFLDEYDTSGSLTDLPRFYSCWCLRVASYTAGNREADMFLLLDRETNEETFHRVGFAETDLYQSVTRASWSSGVFADPAGNTVLCIR